MAVANPFKKLFKRKPTSDEKQRRIAAALEPAPITAPSPELFQQPPAKTRQVTNRLPRFQTSASDHLDPRRGNRMAQFRVKVRNAFTPSQPVSDPRMFAGRQDVLTHMIRAIEDQRLHLVIYGERGIGKTSLLHTLADAAREARYIVVYWSCGAASNFDETFRAAAAEIPLLFHSGFAPTTTEAETGSTLADLLPTSRISPRMFGELCAKLTGTRVLIILDEFDRSDSAEFRRDVAELIKIASDRAVRVNLIIAGVAADLSELVQHIPSIRRNILAFRVPLMSAEEITELVDMGERAAGITFDRQARNLVVTTARGSPHIASLLCHHAALAALEENRTVVQPSDLAVSIEQALIELRDRIPASVQALVDNLRKKGAGRHLATLAATSMQCGGDFTATMFEEAGATPAEAAACKRIVDELAAQGELIKVRHEDEERHYTFLEDGVPPYLWLLCMHEQLNAPQAAPDRVASVG